MSALRCDKCECYQRRRECAHDPCRPWPHPGAPIAEEFARRLAERLGRLRVGPGLDASSDVGPLVTAQACDDVHELVRTTADDGANILTGGGPSGRPGYFYAPTVLSNVSPGSSIAVRVRLHVRPREGAGGLRGH